MPSGPGYGIPSEIYNAVSGGTGDNFEINYLDPDFKLPSEWKLAAGITHYFPDDYVFSADILISRTDNAAIVLHGDLEKTGTNEDGYPIYDSVREASFVLTNSETSSTSYSVSTALQKTFDNGVDWMISYAYTDAEDVQPMNSAVAFSNYTQRAFFDPQEQVSSTSNYNVSHRFTTNLNYVASFIDGYYTRFSLFGLLTEGQPYSYTFDGTINPYGFTPYLDFEEIVLRPGDNRNSENGSWWGKLDLKITQELPAFSDGHKSTAFLVVDNFTNLLNDDWGILNQADFPNTVGEGDLAEPRVGDASLYQIRFGVEYSF